MKLMQLKTALLPHQKAAWEKLCKIRIGALYMGMGTGKTRTALEFAYHRLTEGKIDHVLWLCPCSVKKDLVKELNKHSDIVSSGEITICGIETLSSSTRMNLNLLELVRNKKVYLFVDESSLVKNPRALRSRNITRIADYCRYKMILNGTPITKNAADLFSQWYLLDWRILGYRSYWSFAANHIEYDENTHGKIRRVLNVNYLTEKIAPYTYQITKEECLKLPSKLYQQRDFELTDKQKENYDEVISELLLDLYELPEAGIYKLFGALQAVISGFRVEVLPDLSTKRYPMFDDPHQNPRMKTLLTYLEGNTEKTIIFCTYVQEIQDILQVLNSVHPDSAVPFYGEIPQRKRQDSIEKFRENATYFVATKNCGAYGLNLQFCHQVVYYSNDWDFGTRIQSEDRTHRLGQTEEVVICDICASESIDVKILQCLQRKESILGMFRKGLNGKERKQAVMEFLGVSK